MEDYKPSISIIIPIYNNELYIGKCIDSILSTELSKDKLEIIVVDDGSIDNSAAVVNKYKVQHPNIYLFQQENQGSSVARNLGISKASGDYIWCIDSDDYIESNNFQKAYDILIKYPDLDILSIDFYKETENHTKQLDNIPRQYSVNQIISGREAVLDNYIPASMCCFFIRRVFYQKHNFKFRQGILHQDSELSLQVMVNAKKVYFSTIPLYTYFLHQASTTHHRTPQKEAKLITDDIIIIDSFRNLAHNISNQDKELSDKIIQLTKSMQFSIVYQLYRRRKYYKEIGIYQHLYDTFLTKKVLPLTPPYKSLKIKLASIFFNLYFRK